MEVNDEVTHFSVVDRFSRLGQPRLVGSGIIGIETHYLELGKIAKGDRVDIIKFTAKKQGEEADRLECWRSWS